MAITPIKDRLQKAYRAAVWEVDVASKPRFRAILILAARILHAVAHEIAVGQLNLRAMSLVYTTLLSLVPLLALSFSVLKAFGVYGQLEPMLLEFLAPLGPSAKVITTNILAFVDNMKVGILGAIGLGMLLYTVIALMQKIERSFNYTWHVRYQRRFTERVSDYLSVLVFGPVLVFSAMGITATVMKSSIVQSLLGISTLSFLINSVLVLVPYLFVIAAFTVLYIIIPNTKVRVVPALIGAIVGGILWESSGWAFASFVANSTKYTAIYSALATLIVFMIWLYLSWLILLVGAVVAFYVQNPGYLSPQQHDLRLSNILKEKLALGAMFLIGKHFYEKRAGWTLDALAQQFRIQADVMRTVLELMEQNEMVVSTNDEPPVYMPAMPLDSTRIKDVLDTVRAGNREAQKPFEHVSVAPEIKGLFKELDTVVGDYLKDKTLKELVTAGNKTEPKVAQ